MHVVMQQRGRTCGQIIEANPDYHGALLDSNRHAYVLRACLICSQFTPPDTTRFASCTRHEIGHFGDYFPNPGSLGLYNIYTEDACVPERRAKTGDRPHAT